MVFIASEENINLNSTWDLRNKGLNSCVHVSPVSWTREPLNHRICSLFPAMVIIVGPTGYCFSLQSMCLFSPCLPKRLLQPCYSALHTESYFSLPLIFILMTYLSLRYLFHSQGKDYKCKSLILPSTLPRSLCYEWKLLTSEYRNDRILVLTL